MTLFSKKKREATCSCDCGCEYNKAKTESTETNSCCGEQISGICCVKVLGSGCKNCHALFENAKAAALDMKLNIEVEYVTDIEKIMEYGAMSMPVLVINEKIAAMGKVMKKSEIIALLSKCVEEKL